MESVGAWGEAAETVRSIGPRHDAQDAGEEDAGAGGLDHGHVSRGLDRDHGAAQGRAASRVDHDPGDGAVLGTAVGLLRAERGPGAGHEDGAQGGEARASEAPHLSLSVHSMSTTRKKRVF